MNDEFEILVLRQGNEVEVTVHFDLVDVTGVTAELWRKENRALPDADASAKHYTATMVDDPDNAGKHMAVFTIPGADNATAGVMWWRTDAISSTGARRTALCGPLVVEAV